MPVPTIDLARISLEEVLHSRFGFSAFRPGQKEAIEALLHARRVLCIQPTGHGKSRSTNCRRCASRG